MDCICICILFLLEVNVFRQLYHAIRCNPTTDVIPLKIYKADIPPTFRTCLFNSPSTNYQIYLIYYQ
jgi:hypothetical protein